ncbi:hypothetical protein ABB37_10145 [Leptomonas pyrrhocoris]|uniref:Uncharacterized protein n=1 Tax=Leptomonas pyrrhocoris TaxID=157538 RepID=A0A0M9FP57_LEPPY|nr:hypothetical protein ABB37_10145 [Leptomonas pyrrhocoris]KPA73069.1 hypothetical protein ABB37_10145 [Leptomonas pyrrhocoris]|eukprot:XP_015651508.1 hypothetical protein ABB37_10145 [Leptomonas pyrrhocoris]
MKQHVHRMEWGVSLNYMQEEELHMFKKRKRLLIPFSSVARLLLPRTRLTQKDDGPFQPSPSGHTSPVTTKTKTSVTETLCRGVSPSPNQRRSGYPQVSLVCRPAQCVERWSAQWVTRFVCVCVCVSGERSEVRRRARV